MAINITVSARKKETKVFELNVRQTLNGDLMIFDHPDIDIIVLREKKKLVAFAKEELSETVYGAQSRMFDSLKKKGVIAFDSIRGGNVYGSIEGIINESKEKDEVKILLYELANWLEGEVSALDYEQQVEDHYIDPPPEDTTELGEVPHEEEKGSINRKSHLSPYLYGRHGY